MAKYSCFDCGKQIKEDLLKKKIRCPFCGSKILYKPKTVPTKIKAE